MGFMEMDNLYNKALHIATCAHKGQVDKAGCDYIGHPLRVAQRCTTPEAKIVALLHDTIEDTDVTPQTLLDAGIPQEIVDAVLSVTRNLGESYSDFIQRAALNPLGLEVKLADLEDNMDIRRLQEITDNDVARLRKYLNAWRFLSQIGRSQKAK